jgi:hypothetical protein
MSEMLHTQLGAEEIAALSSVYIDKGVKQESWKIQEVTIDGNLLTARASMTSYFISPTDPGGFHLSIFCSQEILSQLANIYLHVAAGLKTKSRESWMRECKFTYRNVIHDGRISAWKRIYRQKWMDGTLIAGPLPPTDSRYSAHQRHVALGCA